MSAPSSTPADDILHGLFFRHTDYMEDGSGSITHWAIEEKDLQELRRRIERPTNDTVLLQADLAWCLGKLRGLGHPAEHIEKRLADVKGSEDYLLTGGEKEELQWIKSLS